MKFNIWRLSCIALIFLLGFTLLYLYEFDSAAKKNTSILINEKKSTENKAADLLAEKRSLLDEVANINKEKETLIVKVTDYESKVYDYEKRVNAYEEKIQKMALEIENIKREAAVKDAEITKKVFANNALRKMINNYKEQIKVLNERAPESTDSLNSDERKAIEPDTKRGASAKTAKGPERPATALEPITVTAGSEKYRFKIIDVSKDYGLVAIDAGLEEGIKRGDSLCIFRNETLLGRVVVEKVGEGVSIAKTISKDMTAKVKKGDAVGYLPRQEKQSRNWA
ncbi:MAG: hypothetical protein Q8N91_00900 [Candidatus Omnitrophota bacterium]|nr:hypothetical protein [Candidatus Omnitrophota bacterium]